MSVSTCSSCGPPCLTLNPQHVALPPLEQILSSFANAPEVRSTIPPDPLALPISILFISPHNLGQYIRGVSHSAELPATPRFARSTFHIISYFNPFQANTSTLYRPQLGRDRLPRNCESSLIPCYSVFLSTSFNLALEPRQGTPCKHSRNKCSLQRRGRSSSLHLDVFVQ